MNMFARCLQRPLAAHARLSVSQPVRVATPFLRSLTTPPQPEASSATTSHASTPSSPLRPKWASKIQEHASKTPDNNAWNNIMGHIEKSQHEPSSPSSPEAIWASREQSVVAYLPKPGTPYSGRSVPVHKGDAFSAISKLHLIIKNSNIMQEHRAAQRHEKRGVKRNRLKSLRWRQLFAHEVRKKVKLVNEIRARGA